MRRHTTRRPRDIDQPILDLATHPAEAVTPKVLAACPRCRCDVRTILRMVESGALVGYKIGREWRISIASAQSAFRLDASAALALRQASERSERAVGRRYVEAREGDGQQARRRVNHLVRVGVLQRPDDMPCARCGHTGPDFPHEYHHHCGYGPSYHEDVIALCAPCHRRAHHEDIQAI